MRTFRTLLFFVAASFLITSCKKDKDKKSNTELITASSWVIQKFEEKANNDPWTDNFPYFDECSKDDKWIFNKDLSLDMTEGANACTGNSSNEVLDSTTWMFMDNESKLMIENDTFVIEKLDENNLVISYSETTGGATYYTKVTLGH
ncbi:MAG TPA: hypothetical protein VEB42_05020 [Chitinophagaceae bacterium]|nr:hypothetical protein [Chitinophagaceae bacterium]